MMELDDELVRACDGTLVYARKIIEKWENAIMAERPESLFFLHTAQCTEMWQNFTRVYDAFEPYSSYGRDFRRKCVHVFAEFYNIVEHGRTIMEICSKRESWLEAAIPYGDNKWMFQELSENLQVCVDCACELTKSSTFSTHKPLNHVKVALLPEKAEENFKKDTASLKAKLEDLVNRTGSEKNEIHLAEYLLDRQNFMPTSDSICGAQSSSNSVSDSQSLVPSDAKSPKKYFQSNRHYPTKGDDCEGDVKCIDDWLGLKCFKKNFNTEGYDRINLTKFLEKFQKEMSLGIKYMHDEKVVHRDLKPQNIGVSSSRRRSLQNLGYVKVKLIDLGEAKLNISEADQPTYKTIGTKLYMAPEAEDSKESDCIDWRLADTYSFAMTCSEILTFEKPPRGRERRPELPRECPDYLREFLEKCWAKNPKSRPYFEEIVLTLKEFKRHLLLGTVPECAPPTDNFMTRLIGSRLNFWLENLGTKDISTLRVNSRELEQIKDSIAHIEKRLKFAKSVVQSMEEHRRQVIICPTQCSHLVEECMNGVKQVTSAYHNLDPKMMVDLFRLKDKKLHGLARSLDALITSLMVAKELVGSCSDPHQWKLVALALSVPSPSRRVRTRFGYCLWELYWSLYVTRSHLDATYSPERGPLILTSLSFKWSDESCKFVLVAKPIAIRAADLEIGQLEADREEEFLKADEERQKQDRELLMSGVQNSTLEEPQVNHWHLIGICLESLCASIWKVPTTKFDSSSLPPELGAMLRRRLQNESHDSRHEPRSNATSTVPFYDLNNQKLDLECYECWVWGVIMRSTRLWLSGDEAFEVLEILVRVQHPNIVNLIGFQGGFQPYILIFEPMTTTLFDLIKSNMAFYSGSSPFSFPVTLDILLQIVEAMIHAHECGVLHLGLCPKNILVQPKNTIDRFGTADLDLHLYYNVKLARFEKGILVNPNGPVGSDDSFNDTFNVYQRGMSYNMSPYMAPELLERGEQTKFADVWSFGITTYFLVSGSCPFESMDYDDMRRHLLNVGRGKRQLSLAFGVAFPRGLKTLIQKCCVVDPYARISFEVIRKELWTLRKNFDIDGLQE